MWRRPPAGLGRRTPSRRPRTPSSSSPPTPGPSCSSTVRTQDSPLGSENLQSAASCVFCDTVCRRVQPLQRGRPVRAGARPQQVHPPCSIAFNRSLDHQLHSATVVELLIRSALQLMGLQLKRTGASGTCRCRASRGGSSFRGQGDPPTTSPAWFSSRRTGGQP